MARKQKWLRKQVKKSSGKEVSTKSSRENRSADISEDMAAVVQLSMTRGVGTRLFRKLVNTFGSAQAVLQAGERKLAHVNGVGKTTAEAIASGRDCEQAKEELDLADKTGAYVLTVDDPDYPEDLRKIYDPPLVLFVKGRLQRDEQALSIVGTRRPTYYGQQQAEKLARSLAANGWAIVAGLARGIDSYAHHGAVEAGGRTIAVLGSGILKIYPRENKRLADQIAESGAVVSEFPMTAKPDKWNFPRRNRILSGLCRGVIVVEAAANSGSLITATWAVEQNRTVFAVPGRVDNPLSAGCHALIRDGAVLIRNTEDILEELGSSLSRTPDTEQVPVIPNNLPENELAVIKLLNQEPKHIDDIIAESGMPAAMVSSNLVMLEIKKLIVQLPGKNFALA